MGSAMTGIEIVFMVVLVLATIGFGIAAVATFASVRFESYLARWSLFLGPAWHMRPGRAIRVLRVLAVGTTLMVGGLVVLNLPAESLLSPDGGLLAMLVWVAWMLLVTVLGFVVALTGRPRLLVVPQVRGLTTDEADQWVHDHARLPGAWQEHVYGRRLDEE